MSEFTTRLKDRLSSVDAREPRTQLTLSGILAAIILLTAIVATTTGGSDASGPAGSISEHAAELAREPDAVAGELPGFGSGPLSGGGRRPARGSEASAGDLGSAPESLAPVTATEIKIGFSYIEEPGSATEQAGFSGIGQVDQRRGWEAMIREINRDPPHGRKIVPVWYKTTQDDVQSKGGERIAQEMCAHYTQDNKVFMVWDYVSADDTFHACLKKAGVPSLNGFGSSSWSKTYQDFPLHVDASAAGLDRMASFQVDRLYDAGYFSKFKNNSPPYSPQKPADGKPRIGLIRYNEPAHKAGAEAMKSRLAAHGLALCDGCEYEVAYSDDNAQEQLDDATEVNAAIQSFKSKGVTHVMFLGSTAGLRITLFFVDGAEKQQYRPRLGLNTRDGPNTVKNFLGSSSYPQFRDSLFVTYDPSDFAEQTPAYARCKKIFEDAGETFGGDDTARNKDVQIPGYCDAAWFYRAAMAASGKTLTVDAWMDGVHKMSPIASAGTYRMQTKLGRHDGAGAIRMGAFFDDCDCFKPTSGEIPV